jgi:hypothetical protein
MAAKFYFFTDTDLLSSQLASDAFGPAKPDNKGNDQYRISSMHSASSSPAAYAICDGIVCAQDIPDTSPALVNLILKPLDRPPINFVPVRYYVYKGILKSSLFANDTSGASIIAAAGTNQLTEAIWNSQDARNQLANTPNIAAPASALGVDLSASTDLTKPTNYEDAQPIDNLFFRTGVDAQFPVVKGGWSIGTFDNTRFGFEILLEGLGYRHTLALTRSLEDFIKVPTLAGTAAPDVVFAHWHDKEKVLGFMDPCAFYGSFYGNRIRAKTSTGSFDVEKADSLFSYVVPCFFNRNRAYIDIRNEHNNSFNYFNNYRRQIELALDATNPRSQLDYYATGWPILIIEGSQFATNSSSSVNTLRIALPAGDNALPLLYLSQGYRNTGSSRFPGELSSAQRVIRVNVQGLLTDEVSLALPNVASSAQPMCCYVRLKYFKRIDSTKTSKVAPSATVQAYNYFDNIFYPLELQTTLSGASKVKSVVYDENIYVDATADPDLKLDFIGKVGFAADSDNVTLFAFPTFVITGDEEGKSIPLSIIGKDFNVKDTYLDLLVDEFSGNGIAKTPIVQPPNVANAISVVADAATNAKLTAPNFAHFIALIFDIHAYQDLLNLAASPPFLPGFRVYLAVKNITPKVDTKGTKYITRDIFLRGYVLNSSTIEVLEQTTNIKVYSQ